MRPLRSMLRILAPVILILLLSDGATAQTVRGELVEQGTGRPINGALVVLLDGESRQVAGSLTDARGRFTIVAPAPGEYRLRAERIGHASTLSDRFSAAAGTEIERQLVAPLQAISLEGITATTTRRCRSRPEEGLQTQRVWEEARKALNATAWAQEQSLYRFRLTEFAREVEAETGRVRRQETRSATRATSTPYVSAPAEELAEAGYVQVDGEDFIYYAPDAEHLLSDAFLDGHCFRVVIGTGDRAGQVGLAFQPVAGRRLPDINGTLWLHRVNAHLSDLEFHYTGIELPAGSRPRDAGGRLVFERLPDGAWIVNRWEIRMPLVGRPGPGASPTEVRAGIRSQRVVAVREQGGQVVDILGLASPREGSGSVASVTGTVLEEGSGRPLVGATVFLGGTGFSAETAEDGSFAINGIPAGSYSISYFHPQLTALGVHADPMTVELVPAESLKLRLTLPGRALSAALSSLCPTFARNAGGAMGFVRERVDGGRIGRADVEFRWSRFELGETALVERWHRLAVTADEAGFYAACDLPSDRTVRGQARQGVRLSTEAALEIPEGELLEHHFAIAPPTSR
jgi:hypothetical protein